MEVLKVVRAIYTVHEVDSSRNIKLHEAKGTLPSHSGTMCVKACFREGLLIPTNREACGSRGNGCGLSAVQSGLRPIAHRQPDGVLVRSVENTHWHQPLFLIFDSETMPEWFGMPDDKDLPSTFSIEYVRAWKVK
jgi:hypothetical protein